MKKKFADNSVYNRMSKLILLLTIDLMTIFQSQRSVATLVKITFFLIIQ